MIEFLEKQETALLSPMHELLSFNNEKLFVKQILNLKSIPDVDSLSAITIMCEISDFNPFSKPKQLLAYFGLDPTVKQSGNFTGTSTHISERGSALARRALFAVALSSIRKKNNGQKSNHVLHDFYINKCKSKAKKVVLVAVIH